MIRIVKPEILDSLPEDHPDAIHNRRDIRMFNRIMGNFRWFSRQLRRHLLPGDTILEIGAGTGDLGRHLRRTTPDNWVSKLDGLDLCSRPSDWPESCIWHKCDLRSFAEYDRYTVILANLVLHQFDEEELRAIGRIFSTGARLVLTSETARRRLHIHQLRGAFLLGINYVSRHDAKVSIEGGFLGDELPGFLGLDPENWDCDCETGFLGQYRMIAKRR